MTRQLLALKKLKDIFSSSFPSLHQHQINELNNSWYYIILISTENKMPSKKERTQTMTVFHNSVNHLIQ